MTAYYNEIDPYAAQWLRNLIAAGHIAPGDVDERSIVDVRADDLRGYRQCHFFAGIGVWSYALRRAGWPDELEVWTGSCPCQSFSGAGSRGGFDDERHLWPNWQGLIRERKPSVVFGEQVASQDGLAWLDFVCADLEAEGYAIAPFDLCAAGFGAPHIRQRLFFVAHAGRGQLRDRGQQMGSEEREVQGEVGEQRIRPDAGYGSAVGGMADANGPERWSLPQGGFHELDRANAGREEAPGGLGLDCEADALGNAECDGLRSSGWPAANESDESGDGPVRGFWKDAIWIPCRDGKARPVKPGIEPLVNGATGRVGRLRAYGNAINAEVAAEFIRAYRDAVR